MTSTYPKQAPLNHHFMTVEIPDISTADQRHVVPGFRGKVVKAWASIGGALTTADADITLKIEGTAVTGGVITVAQSGSAEGDAFSTSPTAANVFNVGEAIEVETDGGSTGTHEVVVTLELEAF